MGKEMKLHTGHINILKFAGFFHDIGKADIPREIIEKNGPLTPTEKERVKQHARSGFLKMSEEDYNTVKKVIVAHHEFIKQPYPRTSDRRSRPRQTPERRTHHEKIQLMAQILALCDMYDALASRREYKEPYSRDEALRIVQNEFTGDKRLIQTLSKIV